MSEPQPTELPEGLEPAEAFALLGDETRIAILQALWSASDRPVPFSALRRRAGVDDSAQFNYHLGKLTDHFVERTDDGYDFRYAGEKVVRAILAGSFTERVERTIPVDGACHDCGGDLEAEYRDEQVTIACTDCGNRYGRYPFPPGGLKDRTDAEIMSAFNQRVRHLHCLAKDGVCPECGGRMSTEVVDDTEDVFGLEIRVDHTCERCRHLIRSPVGLGLLDHSAVVSFYDDHGVELSTEPYWTLDWCVDDDHTTVLSRDPWRLQVDIRAGDELLSVTLDGDLNVVDVSRGPGEPSPDTRSVA
ncbi:winged helix-turn-helix domain-containing protein [Halobacteriaceae archaeon GCM10025711]